MNVSEVFEKTISKLKNNLKNINNKSSKKYQPKKLHLVSNTIPPQKLCNNAKKPCK